MTEWRGASLGYGGYKASPSLTVSVINITSPSFHVFTDILYTLCVPHSLLHILLSFSCYTFEVWKKLVMRLIHQLALLAILLSTFVTASFVASPGSADTADAPIILRPIKLNKTVDTEGLDRREAENFQDLDFQTQSELIFGSPGGSV